MREATLGKSGISSEAEVLDLAEDILGPLTILADQSPRPRGEKILRVQPRSGDACLIKWYRDKSSYLRESDALTLYAPALGSAAPKLIHGDEALRMLLITELRGETVAGGEAEWDPVVHYKAGEVVRRLHETSQAVISDQFAHHCVSSFEMNASKIEGLVSAAAVEEVRSHVDRVLDLPPVTLVPAHRDNHPRNWILDSGQKVKLHNFATSEYDPWVVDVFPLSQEYWRADSQLKLAFLSGYDRQLDAQDLTILKAYHAVMAVSAIAASGRSSGTRLERIRSQDLIDSLLGITLF